MLFDTPRAFGLVLDISQRKAADGRQLAAKIRKQLIDFVGCFEGDDALYLCQESLEKPATDDGERSALVGNWDATGDQLDLGYALEYTLASLSEQDPDGDHALCFISDNLSARDHGSLASLNLFRQKAGLECRFLVVGVGLRYNRGEMAVFCQSEGIDFRHVGDPDDLGRALTEWTKEI